MYVQLESAIGNTPLIHIDSEVNFSAKIEGLNLFGSMKDRAALYTIKKLISSGTIDNQSTIIESSSGNFAVSLAGICRSLDIPFVCVSDPLMNKTTRQIILSFGAEIIMVDEPDENNIYVTRRLEVIEKMLSADKKLFWINQYDSSLIREAYKTLAVEILEQNSNTEVVFVPVSSCGTISSLSKYLKEMKPSIRIVAVDLESSSIFAEPTVRQKLPGMGFNRPPGNVNYALVDDVIIVNELSCIIECRKLLKKGLMVGPSSGAVVAAIRKFCLTSKGYDIVGIFPDKGDRYVANVYNDEWCSKNYIDFKNYLK